MRIATFMLIFSVVCLHWTPPSHAISLPQKLLNLQASLVQFNETVNENVTDLREQLLQFTATMSQKLIQLTETMGKTSIQMSDILAEVVTASSCPENFTRHEGSCYYFSQDLPHDGDRGYARAMCQMKGSNLVAIETKQEADFIRTRATSGRRYWTSAHRHGGYWVWESTGVNLTDGYQPWQTDQPNEPTVHCAFVHGCDCKLYDHSCSRAGLRYICETKLPSCV